MSSTLQDIVQNHQGILAGKTSYFQERTLRNIATCGTAEQGEITLGCDSCEAKVKMYKSCRSRYCNRCGHRANALWLEKQVDSVLPVPHALVTFTVPSHLRVLFRYNPKLAYTHMFKCCVAALSAVIKTRNKWGNDIALGMAAFLHTWTQILNFHPHVHILMPLGGWDENEQEWLPLSEKFLAHYEPVTRLFKRLLGEAFAKDFRKGRLMLPKGMTFDHESQFMSWFKGRNDIPWRVDFSMPHGKTVGALDYMARYVNRTAVANSRLSVDSNNTIHISYKDRNTKEQLVEQLKPKEFMNRFLMHILPKGFTRIRWYGFMSCAKRRKSIDMIRDVLGDHSPAISKKNMEQIISQMLQRLDMKKCPLCKVGNLAPIPLGSDQKKVKTMFWRKSTA